MLFIGLLTSQSCIKNVDLDLKQSQQDEVLVIDGQFNNLNLGNYVRLTRTRPTNSISEVQPVVNAFITVSSASGEIDTLISEKLLKKGEYDTLFEGYYYSKKIKYKVGETYHLEVLVDKKRYQATSTMPAVPAIDSVNVFYDKNANSGEAFKYLPLLSFHDPRPDKNYYMTQVCWVGYSFWPDDTYTLPASLPCSFRGNLWNVAIIADTYLPEYVKDLDFSVGTSPNPNPLKWLGPNQYMAYLFSLTPEAYSHYEALIKSITSDGGVFSPTPANAPTNIESDYPVAGFFNTSGVSSKFFRVNPVTK